MPDRVRKTIVSHNYFADKQKFSSIFLCLLNYVVFVSRKILEKTGKFKNSPLNRTHFLKFRTFLEFSKK